MLAAGTIIDERFEIISCLGVGGFGSVYKARQHGLDRIVALKILHDPFEAGEAKARFEREAAILSDISHKGIALFYGFGYIGAAPYMVMEYIAGNTLRDLLRQQGKLSIQETINIAKQLCEALQCIHARGVIHRDLQPNNVILINGDAGQNIKLIDFGLARARTGTGIAAQRLTEVGTAVGTAHFMSPEQCAGEELDKRSDIYSLGCLMYNCLAGHTPFDGTEPIVVMKQHAFDEPPPLVTSGGDRHVSNLIAIVEKAMKKAPEERYQDCETLLTDLNTLAKLVGASTEGNKASISASTKTVGGAGRPKALALALITAICCLAAGVFLIPTLFKSTAKSSLSVFSEAKSLKETDEGPEAIAQFETAIKLNQQDKLLSASQLDYARVRLCRLYEDGGRHLDVLPLAESAMVSMAQRKHLMEIVPVLLLAYTDAVQNSNQHARGLAKLEHFKKSITGCRGEFELQLPIAIAELKRDLKMWQESLAELDSANTDYLSSPSDHARYYSLYADVYRALNKPEKEAIYREKQHRAEMDLEYRNQFGDRIHVLKVNKHLVGKTRMSKSTDDAPATTSPE